MLLVTIVLCISGNNRCRVYPASIITRSVRTQADTGTQRNNQLQARYRYAKVILRRYYHRGLHRASVTDRESVLSRCVFYAKCHCLIPISLQVTLDILRATRVVRVQRKT